MSSYFNLELDTTPPIIDIYTPFNTQNGIITNIYITSTENIGVVEELYIIDAVGNRLDLNADINEDQLDISVNLNIARGIATLYCKVKDEVFNLSDLFHKSFEITGEMDLKIVLDMKIRRIDLFNKIRRVDLELVNNPPVMKLYESRVDLDLIESKVVIK